MAGLPKPAPFLRLVSDDDAPEFPRGNAPVEEIYRRYAPYVARVALRLLGQSRDLEDLVQDVFVQAMAGLSSLRDPSAIRGWLAAVTTRVVGRRLRVRKLQAFLGMDAVPHLSALEAPEASPEERALLMGLYGILESLPVAQRTAWVLRYVEEESLESVAAICGCSLAAAKRRIAAAQARIEEALAHG